MSEAAAHDCAPAFVSGHAGKFFTFTRDTAAALLRAVAVAAEGEDIETPCRPRRIGGQAGVAAVTGMQKENATILAIRREARPSVFATADKVTAAGGSQGASWSGGQAELASRR